MCFSSVDSRKKIFTALLAVLAVGSASGQTVRGRDPWVFRLGLENKTRMLVLALRSNLWAAYNPANGTLHKVWSGGIQYRGKVYDFGQRNSVTTGTTYHLIEKGFVFSETIETAIPNGWSSTAVAVGTSAWSFTHATNSVMTSPTVDLMNYDNLILAYQLPGADNRLLVDVSADGGSTWNAQQWMSSEAAADDGNQKLVAVRSAQVKFRFRRNTTGNTARLADVMLFGDYRAWSIRVDGETIHPVVDWRGYRLIDQTEGVVLSYDLVLPGGSRISIQETPEAMAGIGLSRQFELQGIPEGARVSLELDGVGAAANHAVNGGGALTRAEGSDVFLDFSNDSQATLEIRWNP